MNSVARANPPQERPGGDLGPVGSSLPAAADGRGSHEFELDALLQAGFLKLLHQVLSLLGLVVDDHLSHLSLGGSRAPGHQAEPGERGQQPLGSVG